MATIVDQTHPDPRQNQSPQHWAKKDAGSTKSHGDEYIERSGHGIVKTRINVLQDASAEQPANCVFVWRFIFADDQLHDGTEVGKEWKTSIT